MKLQHLVLGTLTTCVLVCATQATAQQLLFQDEMTDGSGWGINMTSADVAATFGYDYSADDIPEAPNSSPGDAATTGLKLEANLQSGASSAMSLYPIGESFSGNYMLRFDAWMNYDADERINGGSAGTTEFIGGGIGYDGVTADVGSGAQVIATGDGGSASDWRVFGNGSFLDHSEMTGGNRNNAIAYYSDFLPGVAPPAGQLQLDFPPGTPGVPGFQWVTFEVTTANGVGLVNIEKPNGDRLEIARIFSDDHPFSSDGNISLFYADFFSSVTSRPDLTFGLIDNVEVTQIPEPTSVALLAAGIGGILLHRRRQRTAG